MELDRCTPLRVSDVYVTHRRRYHAMTEDPLHLGQMNTGFKQVRCTAMTKLMKAVERNLRSARNRMNAVADREARQTLAVAAYQQAPLVQQTELFELVVTKRQICFKTAHYYLGQRYTSFAISLLAMDTQRPFRPIESLASARQTCAALPAF
jgi:hypothetical protein